MPLRHGSGPAPAWATGCAGPFLVLMGLLGVVGILLERPPLNFQNGAVLVVSIALGVVGILMIIDVIRLRPRKNEIDHQ